MLGKDNIEMGPFNMKISSFDGLVTSYLLYLFVFFIILFSFDWSANFQ